MGSNKTTTRSTKVADDAKIYERVDHMYICINDYVPRLMFDVSRITEANGVAYRNASADAICERVRLWTADVFLRLRIMFGDVKDAVEDRIAQTATNIAELIAKHPDNCAETFDLTRLMLFDLLTHAHVELSNTIVRLTSRLGAR